MKESKKTFALLGVSIIFMIAGVGSYLFLFFTTKSKAEASAIISEKIVDLSGRESRIGSALSVLRNESENIDKLSGYFFNENGIVEFTKKIEELGVHSDTTITLESLDQGLTDKTVPFLNFRIKATGKFSDVNRLITLLENFPGKLDWRSIRVSLDTSEHKQSNPKLKNAQPSPPQWRLEASLVALNFIK